jgi:hypothetical protein
MPLVINAQKVSDEVQKFNEDGSLSAEIQTLGFLMMSSGLDKITERNCREVYNRLAMEEVIIGAYRCNHLGEDMYYTEDEIRQYIGLEVNVSPQSNAEWKKRLFRLIESAVTRQEQLVDSLEQLEERRSDVTLPGSRGLQYRSFRWAASNGRLFIAMMMNKETQQVEPIICAVGSNENRVPYLTPVAKLVDAEDYQEVDLNSQPEIQPQENSEATIIS